jgi:hypothetical protein
MIQQQREAMAQETNMSRPAGGPDAPGGTPYPDIANTSHATAAAAAGSARSLPGRCGCPQIPTRTTSASAR